MVKHSSSSSSSSSTRKRSYVRGIPKACECKAPTVKMMSRTDANPYRRFYRCAVAAEERNPEEFHCFKWIDEAFENEILDLKEWSSKFQDDMMLLGSDIIEMKEKMERDVSDVVNEAIAEVKLQMKRMVIVFVVCVIVFLSIVIAKLL